MQVSWVVCFLISLLKYTVVASCRGFSVLFGVNNRYVDAFFGVRGVSNEGFVNPTTPFKRDFAAYDAFSPMLSNTITVIVKCVVIWHPNSVIIS